MDRLDINNVKAYKALFNIENSLRCYILKKLSVRPNWWFDFKQRDFFKICDKIKEQNNNEYSEIYNYDSQQSINKINQSRNDRYKIFNTRFLLRHEIFYTYLIDLYPIVKNYWNDYFSESFNINEEKELFFDLKALERLRNDVMHNIPITDKDLDTIIGLASKYKNIISEQDLEEYFKCYSIKDVIKDFDSEIKLHKNTIKKFITCKIESYEKYKNEWWFNETFFLDDSEILADYYKNILEINKKIEQIKIDSRLDATDLINFVESKSFFNKHNKIVEIIGRLLNE